MRIKTYNINHGAHAVAYLANALRYKPEGRRFDCKFSFK